MLAVVLVGLIGITIGSGLSILVPPETLAAWLPVSPQTVEGNNAAVAGAPPAAKPGASPSFPLLENLTSASDTITLAASQQVEPQAIDLAPQPQERLESGLPNQNPASETNMLPDETALPSSTEPSVLIGPAVPVDPTPVDPALLAHQPAYPGEKWIEVNVTTQEVTAWEGNVPVMSFISSTGLPNTPTVLGEYNIYWKLEKTLMTGPGYYLPNVPNTMYFYQGYALHGTYWHDNFGQPMSRGCVNMTNADAQWLFEWAGPHYILKGPAWQSPSKANVGTLVVVHE
jgi:lipoprotein-anchoring transpeptidase ErfK/SrfK